MFKQIYQPLILPHFKKNSKWYRKKYRHLQESLIEILEKFEKSQHVHLGNNIYKIRFKTSDIAKGKSKSFRLIVLVMEVEKFLVPMVLYFKGDRENITKKELNDHLETILLEMRYQEN